MRNQKGLFKPCVLVNPCFPVASNKVARSFAKPIKLYEIHKPVHKLLPVARPAMLESYQRGLNIIRPSSAIQKTPFIKDFLGGFILPEGETWCPCLVIIARGEGVQAGIISGH